MFTIIIILMLNTNFQENDKMLNSIDESEV